MSDKFFNGGIVAVLLAAKMAAAFFLLDVVLYSGMGLWPKIGDMVALAIFASGMVSTTVAAFYIERTDGTHT